MSSYHSLAQALHGCRDQARGGRLALGAALDRFDAAAFCLVSIVLVLPAAGADQRSALPVRHLSGP